MRALSRVFRGKFVALLEAARPGRLARDETLDDATWRTLIGQLYAHDWVVYAKQPLGGPAQMLDYLARYTHRVAISNERIVGMPGSEVAFRVRAGDGEKKRVMRLPGAEFIRRYLLHVLPSGFKRIRHYGLLAPGGKRQRLAAARQALDVPPPEPAVIESVEAFLKRVANIEWLRCPHCRKGEFRPVQGFPPPRRLPPAMGPP